MKMDRHHLLEIILWPNGDGTFREIRNSRARLKELGIYNDWKMCIEIPCDEHARLHNRGDRNNMFNKSLVWSDESKNKLSESIRGSKHPLYGKTKELSSNWKGNDASYKTKKRRMDPSRSPEAQRIRRAKRKSAALLRAADEVRAT